VKTQAIAVGLLVVFLVVASVSAAVMYRLNAAAEAAAEARASAARADDMPLGTIEEFTAVGEVTPVGSGACTAFEFDVYAVRTADGRTLYAFVIDAESETRPFSVLVIGADGTNTVFLDFDRDGNFDRKGEVGSLGIGDGPCDAESELVGAPRRTLEG
jgi:hypothetical protein